ncbi:MAG: site-specific integrase [Acidobacteria bacterium]|nr:site-specific integrase [Acidobacteriota bacterium]
MAERHKLMGGKLHVYKRKGSDVWQCSTYLNERNRRVSTKHESLAHAKDFAEDWYLELRGKSRAGLLKGGKTFREAAKRFELEYEIVTQGERSEAYVESHKLRLKVHLLPFFGNMPVDEINAGTVQEYRVHRCQQPLVRRGQSGTEPKLPSRSTLHHEIITLRHVLKTAERHGWIKAVPNISPPYKTSGKVSHRAWFSPKEYKTLYEATRQRAQKPKNNRWKWECEQMHDYVLFMANTGLRPDEAARLEHRDVEIVRDEATGETILEIEVRGKRGLGYCKSTTGAVTPFRRMQKRNTPEPTDLLFPGSQRELFNTILTELNLKLDRDGHRRTAYSLRHTYICFRLMEGADIYQIAKNCRTSVEMIEKFYAAHLKNTLDAAAINVRKPKSRKERPKAKRTSPSRRTSTRRRAA